MIIRLKRAISIYVLVSALWTTVAGCQHYFGTAHAATYYVATTGNNSNPGTEDSPFLTIGHALDTMVSGDTTYVMAGTYTSGGLRFKKSGTRSQPIQLLAMPGAMPIISFQNGISGGLVVGEDKVLIQNGSSSLTPIGWIVIEGFEIRNGKEGIKLVNGHDIVIRRNWIHDNGMGVLGFAIRVTIDRNRINYNGKFTQCANDSSHCNKDHGIYLSGNSLTVTNNLIYDNLANGIVIAGSGSFNPSWHANREYWTSNNWIIANNTLAYNRYRPGIVVWGSNCINARIENNIFHENSVMLSTSSPQGVEFVSGSGSLGIKIRNNQFFASGSGGQQALGTGQPSDLVYTGNIVNVSNPEFINAPATLPASPIFSLTARSPAIDKGLPLPEITTTSFDGITRPQGGAYDIGAYEYRSGNDTQSPVRPAALQIH